MGSSRPRSRTSPRRAGLTKRTFFRHYADKREVLFGAGVAFQQVFVDSLAGAPPSATPLEAVAISLQAGGEMLKGRRELRAAGSA